MPVRHRDLSLALLLTGGAPHRWTHDANQVLTDLEKREMKFSAFFSGSRGVGGTGPTFDCVFGRLAVTSIRLVAVFQVQAQRAVFNGETR